jgi:hypothetical protein
MTISTETNTETAIGNGLTTVFPYSFPVYDEDWLQISIDSVQVLPTEYTVDLAARTVTFDTAPANQTTVVIARIVPATQEVDYRVADAFPAETHEGALDKLTMLVQQASELGVRSIHFPIGDSNSGTLPVASARADKFLAFGKDGEIVMSEGTQTAPTNVQQSGNVTQGNIGVWEGPQLLKDAGIKATSLYGTHNPQPIPPKMDLISGGADGNAIIQDASGNSKDAGFPLTAFEISQVRVTSNWSNNNHAAEAHGLSTTPMMITVDGIFTADVAGYSAGDDIPLSFGSCGSEASNAALSLTYGSNNFQIRHGAVTAGQHILVPHKTQANTTAWVQRAEMDLRITFIAITPETA